MILIGLILGAILALMALFGTAQKAKRWKLRRNRMRNPATTKMAVDLSDNTYKDLWELLQHIASGEIHVPLTSLMESDGTNVVDFLGTGTTPTLDLSNGDTDSHLELTWAASNSDAIIFQIPVHTLDEEKDITVEFQAIMSGATDTPTVTSDTYFDRGDTKVSDTSDALGAAAATQTITIAATDVPSGARMMTCELTPGAHTTDTLKMWDIRVSNA